MGKGKKQTPNGLVFLEGLCGALSAGCVGGGISLCAAACVGTAAQRHDVRGAVCGRTDGSGDSLLGKGDQLDGTRRTSGAVCPGRRPDGRCTGRRPQEEEKAENRGAVRFHKNVCITNFAGRLT